MKIPHNICLTKQIQNVLNSLLINRFSVNLKELLHSFCALFSNLWLLSEKSISDFFSCTLVSLGLAR